MRAVVAALLLLGCVPEVQGRVVAASLDDPAEGVRLRNEGDETVCYVMAPRDTVETDLLEPQEVVLPGEERDLPIGEATALRVLDCAERELFVGDVEPGARIDLFVDDR